MKFIVATIAALIMLSTSACVAAGYSSRGGWFIWPGGLGLLLLIIIVVLLMRRR
jgi:hypothetical protein